MSAIDTISNKPDRGLGAGLGMRLVLLIGRYDLAAEKYRTRQALLNLSDHELRDIGITRADAELEARKGFRD